MHNNSHNSSAAYRCPRADKDDLYRAYHDNERGVPVHDDRTHFEFLLLESFQAGLSRHTILKKREALRLAFDQFDPEKIATYDETKLLGLLGNAHIIRHRGKIQAAIRNAKIFMQIQKNHGSRDQWIRRYVGGSTIDNQITDYTTAPSTSKISDQISKDLKKLGMKYIGSTTIYSYMQATGMVNDHEVGCWKYTTSSSLSRHEA